MKSQVATAPLSQLILQISRVSVRHGSLNGAAQQIASSVQVALAATRVALTFRTQSGRTVLATAGADVPEEDAPRPHFLFARPIAVRGAEYGRLEVDLSEPPMEASTLMLALETVGQMSALIVEHASLLEERSQLSTQLLAEKLLSRAAGVVAARRGIAVPDARRWIHNEAARTERTALQLADRIVLLQESQKSLAGQRGTLRRTA